MWTTAFESRPAEHGLQQYITSRIRRHSVLGMTITVLSATGQGMLLYNAAVVAPCDSYTV